MGLRLAMVNVKARDHSALGRFWAGALGWAVFSEGPDSTGVGPVGFAWPDHDALCLDVVAVPDSESLSDRLRLDLATTSADHRDTGPIAAVVVDCVEPLAVARFWGEAVGWLPHEAGEDHVRLRSASSAGPYLEFHRTPHAGRGRNRIHLDLAPGPRDDQAAEVARLRALGATDLDIGQGAVPWTCLADPEGNEFCVLSPS